MEITDVENFAGDAATADWYLGQVVQSLIDANDTYTASILLDCKMTWEVVDDFAESKKIAVVLSTTYGTRERLIAPHPKSDEKRFGFSSFRDTPRDVFSRVLQDLLPDGLWITTLIIKLMTVALPINWREELLEIIRREGTTNQGIVVGQGGSRILAYANLRFRSQAEIRIAQSLDRSRVMYLPNCSARVNFGDERVRREPDFLICHGGIWGVLEVDGEPFHPASRTVADHERDRLFKAHGIVHVEHYDAARCYQEPDQVIAEFLALLGRNT